MHHRLIKDWNTVWHFSIVLYVGFALSCKEGDNKESKHALEPGLSSKEIVDNSGGKDIGTQDNEAIFDLVFEMVAEMLKNNTFPDSPYSGLDVPEGLCLPKEVIEVSVQMEGKPYELLVGGMSRVDAADSYPGYAVNGQRRSRSIDGKVVNITIYRLRLQL